MGDLPDWTQAIQGVALEATSFRSGLDVDKPAVPAVGEIWLARDTYKLYVCMASGVWTGFDASILVQGILTLYANLAGGGYQIKNIADPTAAQDAATRAYVLAQLASYLALAGGTMSGAIAMGTKKITGMGDPTAAQDAATKTYVDTADLLRLLLSGGTMSGAIAMGSNKVTGLAAPTANADAARKVDVDTVTALLDDVTVAQPSRALGTIYQNSTKIRHVTITVTCTNTAGSHVSGTGVWLGSSSPPGTLIGAVEAIFVIGSWDLTITFTIPPNYYYKATNESAGGGATSLAYWTEWDEH